VMKPEMQEKIKAKIKKSWKYGSRESLDNAKIKQKNYFNKIFYFIIILFFYLEHF
jgi:hypothetical protein